MPKAKLGKPLPPVEDVAAPSQEEIDKAVALWNANCPAFFVGLLEAQPMSEGKSKFVYNKATLQYSVRKTGRVLTRREIADAFIFYNNKMAAK